MKLYKQAWFCALVLVLLPLIRQDVYADGMGLKMTNDGRWEYFNEERQWALIKHEGGFQKMLLTISINAEEAGTLVWIFPVPAAPEKVAIDIVKDTPGIYSHTIWEQAQKTLQKTRTYLLATQLYAIGFHLKLLGGAADSLSAGEGVSKTGEVTVHEQIKKEGMISELITATDGSAIYSYLQKQGFNIAPGELKILEGYTHKNYSFVVSRINEDDATFNKTDVLFYIYALDRTDKQTWPQSIKAIVDQVSDKYPKNYQIQMPGGKKQYIIRLRNIANEVVEEIFKSPQIINEIRKDIRRIRASSRGILVSFPTKDMYFPLLPTSVYGSKTIPLSIRVFGLVSPALFDGIKNNTSVEYYSGKFMNSDKRLLDFFQVSSDFVHTEISIDAPSKYFTQDLTIVKKAPVKVKIYNVISEYPWVVFAFLWIIISMVAGALSGPLVYTKLRNWKGMLKGARVGLGNLFSIVGLFVLATKVFKKKEISEKQDVWMLLEQKGYIWRRHLGAILFGILILTVVLTLISWVIEQSGDHSYVAGLPMAILLVVGLLPHMIFMSIRNVLYVYPVRIWANGAIIFVVILWIFVIARCFFVRIGDRQLFKELTDAGYSKTLFENGRVLEFVFYFSLIFIVISSLLG